MDKWHVLLVVFSSFAGNEEGIAWAPSQRISSGDASEATTHKATGRGVETSMRENSAHAVEMWFNVSNVVTHANTSDK